MDVLVVGQRGMLARELIPCLQRAGLESACLGRPALDITEADRVQQVLREVKPNILINAAAYTAVDQAESEPEAAFAVNRDGTAHLAIACSEARIPMIHVSTDYVFDGTASRAYHERDAAAPLGQYGQSKWQGEEAVRGVLDDHLIVRTAWVYASHGSNFVKTMLRLGREREELRVVNDQHGCPTWSRDLAVSLTTLCQQWQRCPAAISWGTYHFSNTNPTTWYDFAQMIFDEARVFDPLMTPQVIPIPTTDYPTPAKRPANSILDCSKIQATFGIRPRSWQAGLHDCIEEIYTCETPHPH